MILTLMVSTNVFVTSSISTNVISSYVISTNLIFHFFRDLRARLEMAVDHILEACSRIECLTDTDCTTTSNSSSIGQFGCRISKMVGPKKQDFWLKLKGNHCIF